MAASCELPYWTNLVPDVATFVVCDDLINERLARECFGPQLLRHRLGVVRDHARVFAFASWLTAAAGEGCLDTAEVALPVLLPRLNAVAVGVAVIDVASDNSSWARFYLGEPGFQIAEVNFETVDGHRGVGIARLVSTDAASRTQEGGEDDWFASLWASKLWPEGALPSALPRPFTADCLHAFPNLAQLSPPGTKLVRCDGCERDFVSSHAWRCHVEGHEVDGAGCPESMFFPTEVAAWRPEPMRLPAELANIVLPAPVVLKRILTAAREHSTCIVDALMDESLLADRQTTLRAYLAANPEISDFVLPDAWEPGGELSCGMRRWDFCPLLRAGPLAIYRGSEARPHAIRRALLQQGSSHFATTAALEAGCATLDSAVDWLEARRRAVWSSPPRVVLEGDEASRVGLVFDARLDLHWCAWSSSTPGALVMRLEGPHRIHTALEQLWRAGMLQRCLLIDVARPASEAELRAVHVDGHVNAFLDMAAVGRRLQPVESFAGLPMDDVYVNDSTAQAALLCAGAHADVATRVAQGDLDAALCLTRPPGHHAGGPDGFFRGGCFLNNAAVAAAAARSTGAVRRVLILDWDVHHGDGTQEIFYDCAEVLTISLHRFEHAPCEFYPSAGLPSHCGCGQGTGYNVNVAFVHAEGGFGDADYAAAFEILVLPIVRAFRPELLVVAAGFDSARGDPLGGFDLTPAGYASKLAKLVALPSLCGRGPIITLEGGYNVTATAASIEACMRVLLARDGAHDGVESSLLGAAAKPETASSLRAALECQAQHWPCLAGWEDAVVAGVRLGDLVFPAVLKCESHVPCWCGAKAGVSR